MDETGSDEQWASVAIPAHNEEDALPQLLMSLLEQELERLHLEVIVVVNGSSDGTAAAARTYVSAFAACGHQLDVVEISTASKARALNEGDRNVSSFPRLYLDADILLSPNAIWRTVEELSEVGTPLLAAPRIDIADTANRAVRSYSRVWSRLPYIRSHVPGVGFYAVNEAGRRRWWRFPTRMGADDKFVRLHFARDETVVIDDAFFVMFLPERLQNYSEFAADGFHSTVRLRVIARVCTVATTLVGCRQFVTSQPTYRFGRMCRPFWRCGRAGGHFRFSELRALESAGRELRPREPEQLSATVRPYRCRLDRVPDQSQLRP